MLVLERQIGSSVFIGDAKLTVMEIAFGLVVGFRVDHSEGFSMIHALRVDESEEIMPEVSVTVTSISSTTRCHLGITAPRSVPIVRDNANKRGPKVS